MKMLECLLAFFLLMSGVTLRTAAGGIRLPALVINQQVINKNSPDAEFMNVQYP
jgi:hypothetical protein